MGVALLSPPQATHPHTPFGRRSQPIRDANLATFSADFLSYTLVSQTTARHTLTQCGFVVFGSIATTQQNVCNGAYRVIELEQFPVRISKDNAPTPLATFGTLFFVVFLLFLSLLSFFLCIALSDSWRLSPFQLGRPLPSQ